MPEVSPEYLKKLSSTRIFSTLFYPNALAGALLLFLPIILNRVWAARRQLTAGARAFLLLAIAIGALGCLFWSGSKGGWLLMLLLGLVALLQLHLPKAFKLLLLSTVVVLGLAGFFVKYATFFRKGATSVSARFDYWSAATRTAIANPIFGTGPGTFAIPYQTIKRPESEMARLAHNDYLEQASDSGFPGFLAYTTLVVGVTFYTGRRVLGSHPTEAAGNPQTPPNWLLLTLWLGLLAWALQSFFEFSLYIPALAWPAFTFMGLLLGVLSMEQGAASQGKRIDKPSPAR
jgi:O-antigen ligase